MTHITELLARFAADLCYENLSDEVTETTKQYIIDYYAACFAGIRINQTFNCAMEDILLGMGGAEECSYIQGSRKLPCMNAAYLNAVYAHGADMDDGNRKAMGHIGAHVMSAVLTLAEKLGSNGKEVLTAINVGYEVYNRIAAAAQPGLVHRGFHSTGTAGAIACAAAAAKLMGLNAEGIYNSMAMAAIQSSGLLLITESGQSCKSLNPANAARTGILSAELAKRGVESSRYPLESPKGWFHAMCEEPDLTYITEGLGESFTICESYLKPYPSCRHTHCGIEAALALRPMLAEISDIKTIRVCIYPNAINIAGQIMYPRNAEDCKFSIYYTLATSLVKGHFTLEDLNLAHFTEDVKEMIGKIKLISDPSMENRALGIRGARLEIETHSGRILEKTVLIPKGDAGNPFTFEELLQKLSDCAAGIISSEEQARLVHAIQSLETCATFPGVCLYR